MNAKDVRARRTAFSKRLTTIRSTLPQAAQEVLTAQLIDSIVNCLVLDAGLFEVVRELYELQQITEYDLAQRRYDLLQKHEQERKRLQDAVQHSDTAAAALASGAMYIAKSNNNDADDVANAHRKLAEFESNCVAQIAQNDRQALDEIDKLVRQQQTLLEKAGVPRFTVTDDTTLVRTQMFILQLIEQLRHSELPVFITNNQS